MMKTFSSKIRRAMLVTSVLSVAGFAVASCSSTGSTEVLNSVGNVAGTFIGNSVGGQAGEIIRNVAPATGNIVRALDNSDEGAITAAREHEEKILKDGSVSSDGEMSAYLTKMARELASHVPDNKFNFRVRLVRSDALNAYTPGGGLIVIFDRLLQEFENEAQMATVIAHEIGHIVKKHPKQGLRANVAVGVGAIVASVLKPELLAGANGQATVLATNAALKGFSRTQEFEADQIGLELMAKAGYDVGEAPQVFQIFKDLSGRVSGGLDELFRSHPSDDRRIERLQTYIDENYSDPRYASGKMDTAEYRRLVAKYKERKFQSLAAN